MCVSKSDLLVLAEMGGKVGLKARISEVTDGNALGSGLLDVAQDSKEGVLCQSPP